MKKTIMSLGALLLTGAVLASCSNSNAASIKKPSKGKAVSEVSFKAYNDDDEETNISIKKSDSFDDVMAALVQMPTIYMTRNESDDAIEETYTYSSTYKSTMKAKNYYTNTLYDKYESKGESTSSEDYYMKMSSSDEKDETTVYDKTTMNLTSKNVKNKYVTSEKINSETGVAGTTTTKRENGSISERSVDGGRYQKNTSNGSETYVGGKETNSESAKEYKYLKASEKQDDENYNATYYGYDSMGNYYSYKISDFLSLKSLSPYYMKSGGSYYPYYAVATTSINLSNYYDDGFMKDYTKGSFEITDKYIIIKMDTSYNRSVYQDAYALAGDSATESQIKSEYDKLIKGEYKGTKANYEIWINYKNELRNSDGFNYLSFSYLKATETNKLNRKAKYDDDYFNRYGISNQETKDLLSGKEYTMNGTGSMTYEMTINFKDYTKKINSMKDTCKKNNIFDEIDMKPSGGYFW